jgi:hypothetical protein
MPGIVPVVRYVVADSWGRVIARVARVSSLAASASACIIRTEKLPLMAASAASFKDNGPAIRGRSSPGLFEALCALRSVADISRMTKIKQDSRILFSGSQSGKLAFETRREASRLRQ